ncbi:MAG TPA: AAA domain-containing protein [Saprospiraceae bacterium]|nr:AAA domain-containing protein [Saprospiraceae bacterium]HMQ84181.1 AAA domain-containing protein [Saprospiraceae bacterium]
MPDKDQLADLFYKELAKIAHSDTPTAQPKVDALYHLLTIILTEVTRQERLQFTTLFARMAYAGSKYDLDKGLQYYLHYFRKFASSQPTDMMYQLGLKVVSMSIEKLLEVEAPADLKDIIPEKWPIPYHHIQIREFRPKARVIALKHLPESHQLIAREEASPESDVVIQYNAVDRNENFTPVLKNLDKTIGLPLTINLIDVEVDQQGIYHPRAFVLEPDYLVDVTAIAECFQAGLESPWLYLLRRFSALETSKHLLIGNIANFFLDEIMNQPDCDFRSSFRKTFQLYPLAYCLFDDGEIREIMQNCQKHYLNLRQVIGREFQEQSIEPSHCFLEPSFYSETYGLQGRLDVLYQEDKKSAIVELKSGKPFMPNIYGLSPNHFIQTLLYDLLIRSAFGQEANPASYILYSGVNLEEKPLRFAPRLKSQQYEALLMRNMLITIDSLMARLGLEGEGDLVEQGRRFFGKLNTRHFADWKGFIRQDLAHFEGIYKNMSELMSRYFIAFTGFIAREHRLAKVGTQDGYGTDGLASLWLHSEGQKKERYAIIRHMRILENKAQEEEPLIRFQRTDEDQTLANFRLGDIAVLYPNTGENQAILNNQVFKCTIIDITNEEVLVRLRSRQFNLRLFSAYENWNLEPDLLDSSFGVMYRSLFAFAQNAAAQQELLLGLRAPAYADGDEIPCSPELTEEQQLIFQKALAAQEYFLLWGPPGTGKTSMMLKHLVDYLLNETDENILLLAYTNRAVDEICESLDSLGEHLRNHYLRIGSRYATGALYQSQLLQVKTENVHSRKELLDIIHRHRIIVATVSSLTGKEELLQLKSFDRVIIDEASQILEPMLVGLLPRFKRFMLIGDHKQLPAVVCQDKDTAVVHDPALQEIGLSSLSNSLFERLYKRCREQNWDWAYAQLSHQGRMHEQIMAFPSQHFYESTLKILPKSVPAHMHQLREAIFSSSEYDIPLMQLLAKKRLVFLPTAVDDLSLNQKTNRYEANLVADLIDAFNGLYQNSGKTMNKKSLGIITPYRAQIAQIKAVLEDRQLYSEQLTIDTVERYQGGARDIIILSLCTNTLGQLESLSSLSDEGVDRKLNVALTRAREHIVILGNRDLLGKKAIYQELIRFAEEDIF